MNIIHLNSYTAQFAPVRQEAAPATHIRRVADVGFAGRIEDALTQLVFVAIALSVAALLRYGAPALPLSGSAANVISGSAANVIDFGAACGGVLCLARIAKTCIFAVSKRA